MQQETDKPSRKKPFFPVNKQLRTYLKTHGRDVNLPLSYNDLLNITYSVPLRDKAGKDTLWEKALYDMKDWEYLKAGLIRLYAIIRTEGDYTFTKHLDVARIISRASSRVCISLTQTGNSFDSNSICSFVFSSLLARIRSGCSWRTLSRLTVLVPPTLVFVRNQLSG